MIKEIKKEKLQEGWKETKGGRFVRTPVWLPLLLPSVRSADWQILGKKMKETKMEIFFKEEALRT